MSTKKFTFKTDKPTGKYKAFHDEYHHIKLNKKTVGSIDDEFPHKIRLQVIKDGVNITDDNPNCPWKWIILKKENNSIEEAKQFLNNNIDKILETYNLHLLDTNQ